MVCFNSATFRPSRSFPFFRVLHFLDFSKHALHFSGAVAGVKTIVAATGGSGVTEDMERLVDSAVGAANGGDWTDSTLSGGQSDMSSGGQKGIGAGTSEVQVNVSVHAVAASTTCSFSLRLLVAGRPADVASASLFNYGNNCKVTLFINECWMQQNANALDKLRRSLNFTFHLFLSVRNSSAFGGNIMSLVGTEPFMSTLLTFEAAIPSRIDRLRVKQLSSKWAEHKDAYRFTGSPKSTRCFCTKRTHCALTTGSVGNWCIVIPSVWIIPTARFIRGASDAASSSFRFLALFRHIWCCIEVHNATSRSDITCDFGRAMTGTNLKANCAYFENKKNALYIFPALLRLRVVFYRYPTTRNKKKNFCVICTLMDKKVLTIRDNMTN